MQFRIMDLLLTVWVWGNATGILYLCSRWMVEPHATQPTFRPQALAVLFVICGLWVLEGSWWALINEKEIQSVLGWQRRWLMMMMGWMRVPAMLSAAMLTFSTPALLVELFRLNQLDQKGLLLISIFTVFLLLSWTIIFYWWKVRKAYDLNHPLTIKYSSGIRGGAKDRLEDEEGEESEEPQHKNV